MKRRIKNSARDMRSEYDFRKGVRGKHAERYAAGTNVIVLDPDVASHFPTAGAVNETLRAIVTLVNRRLVGNKKPRNKRKTA